MGRWDLQQVPIEEALAQITSGSNVAVVMDRQVSDEETLFVREIYLLSDSALDPKPPLRTAPVPPTAELTRTLASADDPEARKAAAAALGTIGDGESVAALDRALGDVDPRVRLEVVESLGRIGTDEAIRLVAQAAMGSRDANVTTAATRVLGASTSSLARTLLAGITSGSFRR
jgi:HEAT repeat protein